MRKIALEEHFTTPELAKYVARPTQSDSIFADIEKRLADFDQLRLETMDKAGIDVAVLSVTTPGVQSEPDAKLAVGLARRANDLLAREVQKRPRRYAGFAHVAMQDVGAAADELQRAIKDLGFKGALINGQTGGHYLDEDRYLLFWERVQELDVPVYLHPGGLVDHPAMFANRPELNGPTWAWTVETATHALRLVFGGTFKRFPKVKVILGHMGETLPFLLWRFDSRAQLQVGKEIAAGVATVRHHQAQYRHHHRGRLRAGPPGRSHWRLGRGQRDVLGRLPVRGHAGGRGLHRLRPDQRGAAGEGLPRQCRAPAAPVVRPRRCRSRRNSHVDSAGTSPIFAISADQCGYPGKPK